MERLTADTGEVIKTKGRPCCDVCNGFISCVECPINEVIWRLVKYEQTGLTPEQIREMDGLYLEKCVELNTIKMKIENYISRLDECNVKLEGMIQEVTKNEVS